MGIGPFTTYAPPGVYAQTIQEPVIGQLLTGLRVPVLIGTGRETLSQTDFEMVRGSSSQADTPIFGEDVSGRWVTGGTVSNPTLGSQDGSRTKFKVRNSPIVDGSGVGKVTFDPSKVSVMVNGSPAMVSSIDGPNGTVTLLVPPANDDFVTINYFFHRKDTRITDVVTDQVTTGSAVLISPRTEGYSITASSNQLQVFVNDAPVFSTITFLTGTGRSASDVANDVNSASISGLTASVHVDNQGLQHVQLVALGNVQIGSGNANGVFGFNSGDYTNRNKAFRVYNGPIVDGSDGGITTTDPSKVVVKVNGTQVLAKSVDGSNRLVTLSAAPQFGATVSVEYWFNTWQDTFDYLPNSNITSVGNVGIGPGRRDYLNGPDFVIVNDRDQSKIQWGTAFVVQGGVKNGTTALDGTQIVGLLVDDRMYGAELDRFTDTSTNTVSTTKFVLPLKPTTGNGRDTPLGLSVFNSVTNGRMDLPTDNPNLVTAYVGKTWRDAFARGPVTVTEVDGTTNIVTLRNPVPADYNVYATFWYNRIADDVYTFTVLTPGPTGIGQYDIGSKTSGTLLFGARFGTKTSLPQTIQWPSGVETLPDSFIYGGNPIPETVTVTFDSSLQPATNASFTNSGPEPYDIYLASANFGTIVIDGAAPVTVNLATAYKAQLLGQPVTNPTSFLSTDRLQLTVDGVTLTVNVSAATSIATVVTAINAAIDADVQVHADGSGTFAASAPNALASSLTYGTKVILKISGRNTQSATNGLVSQAKCLIPTGVGETDASAKVGLSANLESLGSYSAINQPATMVGTQSAAFSIQAGVTDGLSLNVDGVDFNVTLPSGSAVTLNDVVTAINDAYIAFASPADVATYTANVITVANALRTAYEAHRPDATYHVVADAVNLITAPVASSLATAITLLNDIKAKYNLHRVQVTVHGLDDTQNVTVAPDATNLPTAVALADELKHDFNLHLLQKGVHGLNDTVNVEALADATSIDSAIVLANTLKTNYNNHRSDTGGVFHVATDGVNIVTAPAATNLATLLTLANDIKLQYNLHIPSVVFHTIADGVNTVTAPNATDDLTAITLLNQIKAKFNLHIPTGAFHPIPDVVNTEVSPDASAISSAILLANDIKSKYNLHRVQASVHVVNDTVNVVTAPNATNSVTLQTLTNDIKTKFNLHLSQLGVHTVDDTTNIVTAATAVSDATSIALVNAEKAAYNLHRVQSQGIYRVHGTYDLVNTVVAAMTELVAKTGLGINANKLVLKSRVNTPESAVLVRGTSTGNTVLGFGANQQAGRVQPGGSAIAAALNFVVGFQSLGVAYPDVVPGLGTFLRIDSRSVGSTSTISFGSTGSTTFITDTRIGIVPGTSGDTGENAVAGYTVASSDPLNGSSGIGTVGQTYTDFKTGLRFTILPASAGDYATGGKFTLIVGQTFTCDSSIPIRGVPGVEVTVFNTVGTNPGTTALLTTFARSGNEPKVGDIYYISYEYAKSSLAAQLYQDLKKIQQNFGPPTPENPLSLGARLALLNGAVIVGLKQVLKVPDTSQGSVGSYLAAIDEMKKPISGSVKPDVIVPLGTDPVIFSYLNQHCVFMSSPRQEGERIGVVGTAIGTTPIGVQAIAKGLASELMVVVYPDSFVISVQDASGQNFDRLVDGSFVAAALAGSMTSPALDVATPVTRRQIIGFKQLGRILDPTEANQVAVAGVSVIEQTDTGLRVRHGLTTRTDNVITRTPSVTLTIHFVQQTMRRTLDPFIGQKFVNSLPKQVEIAMSGAFQNMISAQIVAKVTGIVATVDDQDPTIMRTEAIYVPVFPLEYIVATMQIRVRILWPI